MAFEELFNIPMNEDELLDCIVRDIQANFFRYQSTCSFLKISQTDIFKKSKIIWEKSFRDHEALTVFYYETKFDRACILLKYLNGRYFILFKGFHWMDGFEIWPDKIEGDTPFACSGDIETTPMISRELLETGFGDLTQELQNSRRKKAV